MINFCYTFFFIIIVKTMLLISRFITKVLVVVTNKSQCLDDGKGCDKLQLNADGYVNIRLKFKHGLL